ncbi:MAG: phytase [Anaerolinea sp.]|nr:phytase [Anaerolinea sp.]
MGAANDGGDYIIVSIQGSSTFVEYERGGDNAYVASLDVS